jgi:hypothetical protein
MIAMVSEIEVSYLRPITYTVFYEGVMIVDAYTVDIYVGGYPDPVCACV